MFRGSSWDTADLIPVMRVVGAPSGAPGSRLTGGRGNFESLRARLRTGQRFRFLPIAGWSVRPGFGPSFDFGPGRIMAGHRRTGAREAQGSIGHGQDGNVLLVQRTRAWLKPLWLSEVTWTPRKVGTGNGFGGTGEKDALSNSERGRSGGDMEGRGDTSRHGDPGTAETEGKASKGGCARGEGTNSFSRASSGAVHDLRMMDWNRRESL